MKEPTRENREDIKINLAPFRQLISYCKISKAVTLA